MLSRFGFYLRWYARLAVGAGFLLLTAPVLSRLVPRWVPWVAVEAALNIVVLLALFRGPNSYAAYLAAAAGPPDATGSGSPKVDPPASPPN